MLLKRSLINLNQDFAPMSLARSPSLAAAGADMRYASLDGMRGIAAIIVAIFHLQQRLGLPTVNGYLAVDLFFVLSGFVLARIYEPRFAEGLSASKFALQRLLRFYPLYAVGFLLGTCCLFVSPPSELSHVTLGSNAAALAFGAVMLPTPFSSALFPVNGAAWSLFFELGVNLLLAVLLWRLRKRSLAGLMAAALLFLCATVGEPLYLNIGWRWADFVGGSARTLYSFTAGILIARALAGRERRTSALGTILPLIAAIPMLVGGDDPKSWELLAVAAAFPMIVALGAMVDPPAGVRRAMLRLGALSFPLYAVQWPLAALMAPWLGSLGFLASVAIFLMTALALARIAQRLIDEPIQRAIKGWLGRTPERHGYSAAGVSGVAF